MKSGKAIIVGAGPAGLTAALELLRQTGICPIVLEAGEQVGGISRTVVYKGNRMDIGGHRFFSKSDRVMQWWLDLMPVEATPGQPGELRYQGQQRSVPAPNPDAASRSDERVMLVRERKSRIYFLRRFFDYPIRLTADTLIKMGALRTVLCGMSYLRSALLPSRKESSLEDFFINRFGRQLYLTFFKSYTEKVWGVSCDRISAEWGAQRIKGLSLRAVVLHFIKTRFRRAASTDIAQKQVETSLIEKFLYPKLGPGQLWEYVADLVRAQGGEIHFGLTVDCVHVREGKVISVEAVDRAGQRTSFAGDYFFSTMPVRDLVHALDVPPPADVMEVSDGLMYRDFITVGLLASKLTVTNADGSKLTDNWIYVQEPDVLVGRLQIFNNWSPYLVKDPGKAWIGLEYFCYETDELWKLTDEKMAQLAIAEVERIGVVRASDVEDWHVVRVPKTYPAYFGSYDHFDTVRNFMDGFENLFLVGRNGMHKYNNQDHSMLTAMQAVENIAAGITSKDNLWAINTEAEYHEEKK